MHPHRQKNTPDDLRARRGERRPRGRGVSVRAVTDPDEASVSPWKMTAGVFATNATYRNEAARLEAFVKNAGVWDGQAHRLPTQPSGWFIGHADRSNGEFIFEVGDSEGHAALAGVLANVVIEATEVDTPDLGHLVMRGPVRRHIAPRPVEDQ
jgi:hypothetical protein